MKKAFLVLIASLFFFGLATPAVRAGAPFDFKTQTCGDLLELSKNDSEAGGMILLWLDGYLSGLTGDTVFNEEDFKAFAEDLAEFCTKHKELSILTAAEEVGTD